MVNKQVLSDKFFTDPDWSGIEEIILSYINPLKEMDTIDVTQPAEHVKAEVIGRILAYNSLINFLNENRLVTRKLEPMRNPFK